MTQGFARVAAGAIALASAGAHAACPDLEASWQANHTELAAPQVSAVLFGAADAGCAALARTVLAAGASVEARDRFGNMPLAHAARAGQAEVVAVLLDAHAAIEARNVDGSTALLQAAELGRTEAGRVLLEHGADANAAGRSGATPLIAAAFAGDAELGGLLLRHGADPLARNSTGKPAIVYAAARGADTLVAALLDGGIDANARYANQLTVLMWAAGHVDDAPPVPAARLVTLLLDRGAHVDDQDDRGRTALMIAAERGHADIARLLLARGASPRVTDRDGHSAADLAVDATLRELLSRG